MGDCFVQPEQRGDNDAGLRGVRRAVVFLDLRTAAYELIKIGTHGGGFTLSTRTMLMVVSFCETRTPNWLKHGLQDEGGGYGDLDLWSPVFQTGKKGMPTCADCLGLVGR